MIEAKGAIDWGRWLFYFLAAVPLVTWLFFTRDRVLRLAAVVGVLIFLQDSLAGRRYVWAFSIAPSFVAMYVALVAESLSQRRLPSPGAFLPLWIGFLFFAALNIILGSLGTNLWALNTKHFQIFFLEGLFFFLYGTLALGRDQDVVRFSRIMILVALGAAIIHCFAAITGFRFRSAIETSADVYYGALFENPNSLGSFYAMFVPVALTFLVARSLSRGWRLTMIASIVVMIVSLFLTGSRGGMLFTVLMSGVALVLSRTGTGRAVVAMMAGLFAAGAGFFFLNAFGGAVWQDVQSALAEEGLQTSRFSLFAKYLTMLAANPFGIGLSGENFRTELVHFGIPGVTSAHNIYIDIPLQTGIPGLLLFLAMAWLVLRQNRGAAKASQGVQREGLVLLFLPILGFLSVGFFEPIYSISNKLNHLFWLYCGISVAATQRAFVAQRAAGWRDGVPVPAGSALDSTPNAQRA